mmetsp:Transcript_11750/g.35722  ORF Transcript_11750/g.35722 Transcript_11750/m.35722 type:complete len:307 (+) Transcript_11750:429-1349(+)
MVQNDRGIKSLCGLWSLNLRRLPRVLHKSKPRQPPHSFDPHRAHCHEQHRHHRVGALDLALAENQEHLLHQRAQRLAHLRSHDVDGRFAGPPGVVVQSDVDHLLRGLQEGELAGPAEDVQRRAAEDDPALDLWRPEYHRQEEREPAPQHQVWVHRSDLPPGALEEDGGRDDHGDARAQAQSAGHAAHELRVESRVRELLPQGGLPRHLHEVCGDPLGQRDRGEALERRGRNEDLGVLPEGLLGLGLRGCAAAGRLLPLELLLPPLGGQLWPHELEVQPVVQGEDPHRDHDGQVDEKLELRSVRHLP